MGANGPEPGQSVEDVAKISAEAHDGVDRQKVARPKDPKSPVELGRQSRATTPQLREDLACPGLLQPTGLSGEVGRIVGTCIAKHGKAPVSVSEIMRREQGL